MKIDYLLPDLGKVKSDSLINVLAIYYLLESSLDNLTSNANSLGIVKQIIQTINALSKTPKDTIKCRQRNAQNSGGQVRIKLLFTLNDKPTL